MYNFEQSAGILWIVSNSKNILVGTSETIRSPHKFLWDDLVHVIKYSLIYLINYSLNYSAGVTRSYSNFGTKPPVMTGDNTKNLKPVKFYNSLKGDRVNILKEQRDKSGVYCLINKINGHAYSHYVKIAIINRWIILYVSGYINTLLRVKNSYFGFVLLLSLNGKGINNFYPLRNTTFRSRLNKFGRGAIRLYSTQVKTTNITPLDPWFVTGFCDGESNFHVSITSRSDNPLKWRVRVIFQIYLSIKEMPLLLSLQKFFGNVEVLNIDLKSNRAFFVVSKPSDILKVIIPHFQSYPLITQKRKDFILCSKIVKMMDKKEHLTKQGLDIIIKIKSLINNGLNNKVKDLSTELKDKVLLDKFDLAFKITSIP